MLGQVLLWVVAAWPAVGAGAWLAVGAGRSRKRAPASGPHADPHGPGGDGQVHSTAMKMFATVSRPTTPNMPLSTFSSSRLT